MATKKIIGNVGDHPNKAYKIMDKPITSPEKIKDNKLTK
jgi:hypothetical protein